MTAERFFVVSTVRERFYGPEICHVIRGNESFSHSHSATKRGAETTALLRDY